MTLFLLKQSFGNLWTSMALFEGSMIHPSLPLRLSPVQAQRKGGGEDIQRALIIPQSKLSEGGKKPKPK